MEESRLGRELSRKIKKLTRLGPDAEGDGFTEHLETQAGRASEQILAHFHAESLGFPVRCRDPVVSCMCWVG